MDDPARHVSEPSVRSVAASYGSSPACAHSSTFPGKDGTPTENVMRFVSTGALSSEYGRNTNVE